MQHLHELQLSKPLPATLEADLRRVYATPPRAYHHFGHVLDVLGHFARDGFQPRLLGQGREGGEGLLCFHISRIIDVSSGVNPSECETCVTGRAGASGRAPMSSSDRLAASTAASKI